MKSAFGVWGVVCFLLTISFSAAQPFGLTGRVANATLTFPQGPPAYRTNTAFPGVTFNQPMAVTTPPGETNRLFILERPGRIIVITNLASPTRATNMDIATRVTTSGEEGLLGIAFHPGFATNRYFFLFYSLSTTTADGSGRHQRVSRFEMSPSNPNQGLTNTELPLITQRDEASNHNGGDLHFGPDGYLYVTLGDEGNQNDSLANSQRIDKDFFSGILRIDVDKRPENLPPTPHNALMGQTNYFVPADNPFVGATTFNGLPINTTRLRSEFWAVGLRNPWRISFDPLTGVLYCGDVGGGSREEVNVITKGGNYGWNYREGTLVRSNNVPAGFSSLPPIAEYSHGTGTNQGNSITGGIVYRGAEIPELYGKYIFSDWGVGGGSGSVWILTPNGTNAVPIQFLFTDSGISSFGRDPRNGDVLFVDLAGGQINRLLYGSYPRTLADAGVFTNLATLTPHAGFVPYDVNVAEWADGASITRWFSIPLVNARIFYRPPVSPFLSWSIPPGVWIQHFDIELTNGVPESRRRIETRALVRYSGASAGAYGLSYRWDATQTNATLVADGGASEDFVIYEGGNTRTQTWVYPSRGDCMNCHVSRNAFAAGFNTPQLNRDFDYGGIVDNQLRALNNAGYFNPLITDLHSLPSMAGPEAAEFSLEHRVRSYLMANCGHCHQANVAGAGGFDARIYRPLSDLAMVDGALTNEMGNASNRVVRSGSLEHSMILNRISRLDSFRMPPAGAMTLDTQAIALVSQWITNDLPARRSFAEWQVDRFGATNTPAALATADPDGDRANNALEWLTRTDPTNSIELWSGLEAQRSNDWLHIGYSRIANRGFEVQYHTNISSTGGWRFLNVPENRPYYGATTQPATVSDATTNGPTKFYRMRVYEP